MTVVAAVRELQRSGVKAAAVVGVAVEAMVTVVSGRAAAAAAPGGVDLTKAGGSGAWWAVIR